MYLDKKFRARYGQLSVSGIPNASTLAHRTMYMVFYGVDTLLNARRDFVDHLCENKPCCYPRHMELVTPRINNTRSKSKHILDQIAIDFETGTDVH